MIRQFELVEQVKSYDPNVDEDAVNRAYVYAMKMHGSQKRESGDPYFSHPIEVAGILTDLKLDHNSIITALLHDVVEDTEGTLEDVESMFGPEIGRLVDGVTKLSQTRAAIRENQARGELPQAGAGHVRGHTRPAGQAGRPPAQHAHARVRQVGRQAPAHRARDHGHLRAARRAHRHAALQGRAGGPGLRPAQPRRPGVDPKAPGVPQEPATRI